MIQRTHLYRSVALQGSTQLDLMIGAYDAISDSLRLCAAAIASGDIAARCRASDRAMLLIGHLESWLEFLDDQPLQESLARLYTYLRAEIVRLQVTSEPQKFTDLALEVSETRAAWQKRFAPASSAPEVLPPAPASAASRMSWTA